MATDTKIEWASSTWNPWLGCTKVSPGCKLCYAETRMDHRYHKVKWGPHGTRTKTTEAYWKNPTAWEKSAAASGEAVRVFPSLCDVFEDWGQHIAGHQLVLNSKKETLWIDQITEEINTFGDFKRPVQEPRYLTLDHLRRRMFKLIDATPHLTWLLLTKRPENIRKMWSTCDACCNRDRCPGPPECTREYRPECRRCNGTGIFRPNVWLGCSIEDQDFADSRIPELLKCRDLSPVLWVSYEPALAPVDFSDYLPVDPDRFPAEWDMAPQVGIDWAVVGGESGYGARPFNITWARQAVAQFQAAGVPIFVKQLGARPYWDCVNGCGVWAEHVRMEFAMSEHPDDPPGSRRHKIGLRDDKGGDMSEWPIDLQVRQYPAVKEPSHA